jgi:hypothetical protein
MDNFRKLYDYVQRKTLNPNFPNFHDLGFSESGNNWQSINRIGCFGEWQFAEKTRIHLGHMNITVKKFKADPSNLPPELQLKVLKSFIK